MNNDQGNEHPIGNNGDGTKQTPLPGRSSRGRAVLRIGVVAILGFFVVATIHQMLYEPTLHDGAYEWTLRWPGIPPGAKFTTQPGDDVRHLLGALIVDADANWEKPLMEIGTIDVQLSHPAYPSLWTILKWRFGLLDGTQELTAEQIRVVVRMNLTSQQPIRYEVIRFDSSGEAAAGTFHSFSEAQSAVLDELAQAMEGS